MTEPVHIEPNWEPNEHRLYASGLIIDGVAMHLEAIPVETVRHEQHAVGPQDDELIGALLAWNGGSGPFQTATISGRRFVILATPHSD